MSDLKWTISGGIKHIEQFLDYINGLRNFYDKDETFIDTVHDSHNGLRWNGGRPVPPFGWSVDESIRRVKNYNDLGIGVNIIFNNTLIEKRHLSDKWANYFLEACYNQMNGVIVASEVLRNYIYKKFPNYKLIASIAYDVETLDGYKRLLDTHDIVVLHPDYNRNLDFVSKLNTGSIEVLVNESCASKCPVRRKHYDHLSRLMMDGDYVYDDIGFAKRECLFASIKNEPGDVTRNGSPLRLTYEEIDRLREIGVKHFKIQGRQTEAQWVIGEMRYFMERYSAIRRLY